LLLLSVSCYALHFWNRPRLTLLAAFISLFISFFYRHSVSSLHTLHLVFLPSTHYMYAHPHYMLLFFFFIFFDTMLLLYVSLHVIVFFLYLLNTMLILYVRSTT
jgi:hypothetical protein